MLSAAFVWILTAVNVWGVREAGQVQVGGETSPVGLGDLDRCTAVEHGEHHGQPGAVQPGRRPARSITCASDQAALSIRMTFATRFASSSAVR